MKDEGMTDEVEVSWEFTKLESVAAFDNFVEIGKVVALLHGSKSWILREFDFPLSFFYTGF
tara:strand:+ start:2126 stop:2308 length:183 start_codon:yes stop_codon:yes gene_type:complete